MTHFVRKQPRSGRHHLVVDQETNETVCVYHGTECINKHKTKYHNAKTEFNGILYDSEKEARRAGELDLLLRTRQIAGVRRQVRVSFDVCRSCKILCRERCDTHPQEKAVHITTYIVDFVITQNDGTEVYEEVKSFITKTKEWKLKWRLLEILFEKDETKRLEVIE